MFYMGDEGFATYSSENDASADRTWENASREDRRKRRTVNAKSRRGTGRSVNVRSRRGTGEVRST